MEKQQVDMDEVTPPSQCITCCSITWQLILLAGLTLVGIAVFGRDYSDVGKVTLASEAAA